MAVIIPKHKEKPVIIGGQREGVNVDQFENGGALWGRIVGDMKNQADLMAKLNKIEKLAKAGIVL